MKVSVLFDNDGQTPLFTHRVFDSKETAYKYASDHKILNPHIENCRVLTMADITWNPAAEAVGKEEIKG